MSESAPRVLPASLHRPGEREREGLCGGRRYDQVSEGTESPEPIRLWLRLYFCVAHLATGCRGTQLPADGEGSSYQSTGGCRRAL